MRLLAFLLSLSFLFISHVNAKVAPANDPGRFFSIKAWELRMDLTTKMVSQRSGCEGGYYEEGSDVTVRAVLNESPVPSGQNTFLEGKAWGSMDGALVDGTISATAWLRERSACRDTSSRGSGMNGTTDRARGIFTISGASDSEIPFGQNYFFFFMNPLVDVYVRSVTRQGRYSHSSAQWTRVEAMALPVFGSGPMHQMLGSAAGEMAMPIDLKPVPKSGMVLGGSSSARWKDEVYEGTEWTQTARWNIRPKGFSEYEIEVEIEGYDEWIPKGNFYDHKKGSDLIIHARIIDPKTGEVHDDYRVKKFVFELQKTSKMPGSAMNWPRNGSKDFDLRFEERENDPDKFEIKDSGQRIENKEDPELYNETTVILSSFDWGGFTSLKVHAVMVGDVPEPGHLKGDKAKEIILIPKRKSEDEHIAEIWKKQRGIEDKKDADDDEEFPAGDGHKGDGFTLYEEYRGFYTDMPPAGRDEPHFYGDVLTKDLFVTDLIQSPESVAGIQLYENVTGLIIRKLSPMMIDDKRVVNHNKRNIANYKAQHAIQLNPCMDCSESQAAGYTYFGTPEKGGDVQIDVVDFSQYTDPAHHREYFASTVAHEMLHSSAVHHHGDGDLFYVYWEGDVDEKTQKAVIVESSGPRAGRDTPPDRQVQVFFESGRVPVDPRIFSFPKSVFVAVQNGEHSGVMNCIIRYNCAGAYLPQKNTSQRIWIQDKADPYAPSENGEPNPTGLCAAGSDESIATKRYGVAMAGRANCVKRVCINDRFAGEHTTP